MEAHEAAGNPAEALRAFEDLRGLLREELGHHAGRGRDGGPRARPARPAAGAPAPRRRGPGRPPLARAARRGPRRATRSSAARPRPPRSTATWRAAAGGRRRLAVLGGDAGIGKTRLAAELAALAHDDGAVVLFGRFEEEAPAPYQPVVQMLRGWAAGASLEPFAERLGPRAAELGLVLPELGAAGRSGATPLHGPESGAERLRLFDGIAALLAEIAGDAPLLVVLDDLHWADLPTLQLLGHLVRAPAPEAALFLATARRDEGSDALAALLADLRREGTLERIELGGLDAGETAALVALLDGSPATPAFVAELHEETEGNPFFIEEVLRHLAGAGDVALRTPACPTACARSPAAGSRGWASPRSGCSPSPRWSAARRTTTCSTRPARCTATRWSRRWTRRSRRACCARTRSASAATRSRTRCCGRRSTTASPPCAARACTAAWARR